MKVDYRLYQEEVTIGRTKSGRRAVAKQVRSASKLVSKDKCPTGKVRLKDHKDAVRSLHKMTNAGKIEVANNGFTKRRETRTYFCDRCNGYHLTSQVEWTTFRSQVAA